MTQQHIDLIAKVLIHDQYSPQDHYYGYLAQYDWTFHSTVYWAILSNNQSKSHSAVITLLQVSLEKRTRVDNSSQIFSSGLLSVTEWIPLLVLVTAECFSTGCTSDPPLWSSVSRTVVRPKRSLACPWCKGETTERRCCILRFRWQRKVLRNLCFHCNYLIFYYISPQMPSALLSSTDCFPLN